MVGWGSADRRFAACPNEDCTATGPLAPTDQAALANYAINADVLMLRDVALLLSDLAGVVGWPHNDRCMDYVRRIERL